LVREVDPTEQLDEEVEELLLQLADDFVESAVGAACLLAKHRRASTVEVKDVQLHLGVFLVTNAVMWGGDTTVYCSTELGLRNCTVASQT
jgi:hypothetical protein